MRAIKLSTMVVLVLLLVFAVPANAGTPTNRWIVRLDVELADKSLTRNEAELMANRVIVAIVESPIVANDVQNVELVRVRRER